MKKNTKPDFTPAQAIAALEMSANILGPAARKLGCDRKTLEGFIAAHPEVAAARQRIEEELIDLAEGNMVRFLNDHEHPQLRQKAIDFFLRTKGKKRGYTTGAEVTGKGGGAMQTETKVVYDVSKLTLEEMIELEKVARTTLGLN